MSPRTSPNEMLREIPPGIDIETEYPPRIFSSFLSPEKLARARYLLPSLLEFRPIKGEGKVLFFIYIYIFCKMQKYNLRALESFCGGEE